MQCKHTGTVAKPGTWTVNFNLAGCAGSYAPGICVAGLSRVAWASSCWPMVVGLGGESLRAAGLGFCCLFFAAFRGRIRFQRIEKPAGDGGHVVNRRQECSFVRLRRLIEAAYLSHVLERGGAHLFRSHGRIEVE